MANHVFLGTLPDVAQIATIQITGYDVTTTYRLTIGVNTVSVVGSGGSVNTVATALAAACAASLYPEFLEITWTSSTDTVIATGVTAGVPFAGAAYVGNSSGLSKSVSGGAGTMGAVTTTTAPTGSAWWVAGNFDSDVIPAVGDTVYFRNTSQPVKYGLDQSGAGTLAAVWFDAGATGDFGLPRLNNDGATSYAEYRLRYLSLRSTLAYIGNGGGQGSRRMLLDFGNVANTTTIYGTGTSAEQDVSALQMKGTAFTAIYARGGTLDISPVGGETSTVTLLGASGNAFVRCSADVGLTTVTAEGNSDVITNSAVTTINTRDNARVRKGAGAVTTWNAYGSTNECQGSGTITTLHVGSGRTFDASTLNVGVTVTNSDIAVGGSIIDPAGQLVFTNATTLLGCGLHEVRFVTAQGKTVKVA